MAKRSDQPARLLDHKAGGRFPFEYVHSTATDVSKTFARERRRRAAEVERRKNLTDPRVALFPTTKQRGSE